MKIRLEQIEDYREVENLTREAFWNIYRPGCTEHYVLNQYRKNPDFVPELDFVMEEDGKIIGHVMYSKTDLYDDAGNALGLEGVWTFGPISIHPDYKRKGYGLKLLKYSLEKAKDLGCKLICMEGEIGFYKHAGFVVASTLKIHYHGEPKESEVPYFLALELAPGFLNGLEATYHTPNGYLVAVENPEAFEAYDATFPAKEKCLKEGQLPQFCQSCGMPLSNEILGTNADGSKSFDYCIYCYKDGAFTGSFTLEEMADYCSMFVDEYNKNTGKNLTACEYKEELLKWYPALKRWNLPEGAISHAEHPMKQIFIDEVNVLNITDLHITNLFALPGTFINQPYRINGNNVKLFDDNATYWCNQIQKADGRCYGIACCEAYILVSEYGKDGEDAEIVVLKKR